MSDSVTLRVEGLRLDNLGDGLIEQQFQAELRSIAEAFDREDLINGVGRVKAEVNVKVEFEFRPETGSVTVAGSVTSKLPTHKRVARPAIFQGGRFLVEPEDEQLELVEPPRPHRKPRIVPRDEAS